MSTYSMQRGSVSALGWQFWVRKVIRIMGNNMLMGLGMCEDRDFWVEWGVGEYVCRGARFCA